MRKTTFLAGAAVGYVLGARAGRERYEQILAAAGRAKDDPRVRSAAEQAAHAAGGAAQTAAGAAKEAVTDAASAVKDKVSGADGAEAPTGAEANGYPAPAAGPTTGHS